MDEGNAAILKKHGVLIWLSADVKTIVGRIQDDLNSKHGGLLFHRMVSSGKPKIFLRYGCRCTTGLPIFP